MFHSIPIHPFDSISRFGRYRRVCSYLLRSLVWKAENCWNCQYFSTRNARYKLWMRRMHNERESCKERQLQNVSLWNWNENRPNNIGFVVVGVCACVWVHEVSANLLMTMGTTNQLIRSTERERFGFLSWSMIASTGISLRKFCRPYEWLSWRHVNYIVGVLFHLVNYLADWKKFSFDFPSIWHFSSSTWISFGDFLWQVEQTKKKVKGVLIEINFSENVRNGRCFVHKLG